MTARENKKCPLIVFFTIFAVISFFMSPVVKAEVMFIVNASVQQDVLSKSEIKKIFLGDTLVWPDGQEIELVTQAKSDIQKEFVKIYTQKTTSQFSNYWRRIVFSGKGMIPKSFFTDKEVINFVKSTKGAIGYISPQETINDVKTITVSDN